MIGRHNRHLPLEIGEETTETVMSMDNIRPDITDGLGQSKQMRQIPAKATLVDREIPTVHPAFLQGIHLLSNERSISSFLASSDNQRPHSSLKQTAASKLEIGPANLHGQYNETPRNQKFIGFLPQGTYAVCPHHDQTG